MKYFIGLILILFDQVTKYIFYNKGFFFHSFIFSKHVFNTGISWGIKFFPVDILKIITIFIIVVIRWLYRKKYIGYLPFILFLAGGIGNLIDRFFLGGVRDFITIFDWFPTFNVADIYITLGAFLILIKWGKYNGFL